MLHSHTKRDGERWENELVGNAFPITVGKEKREREREILYISSKHRRISVFIYTVYFYNPSIRFPMPQCGSGCPKPKERKVGGMHPLFRPLPCLFAFGLLRNFRDRWKWSFQLSCVHILSVDCAAAATTSKQVLFPSGIDRRMESIYIEHSTICIEKGGRPYV